ncbi:nuclear receptor subfamily 2 group E member 1 [Trichonephila clavipes]|nr:nuclear receptor subfamily 2 group E member 1 [Trichonephila clavipes]
MNDFKRTRLSKEMVSHTCVTDCSQVNNPTLSRMSLDTSLAVIGFSSKLIPEHKSLRNSRLNAPDTIVLPRRIISVIMECRQLQLDLLERSLLETIILARKDCYKPLIAPGQVDLMLEQAQTRLEQHMLRVRSKEMGAFGRTLLVLPSLSNTRAIGDGPRNFEPRSGTRTTPELAPTFLTSSLPQCEDFEHRQPLYMVGHLWRHDSLMTCQPQIRDHDP